MLGWLRRQQKWHFFALLSVFNAVLIPFSIQRDRQAEEHIQEVEQAELRRVAEARRDRIKAVDASLFIVCEENNRQDRALTRLLQGSVVSRKQDKTRPPMTAKERKLLQQTYREIQQQNCADLPSINGNAARQGVVRPPPTR